MAPADIYRDDAALFAFLDSQADALQDSPLQKSRKQPVHADLDVSFTTQDILQGLSTANSLLIEGNICPPLPDITPQRDNVPDILAAALSSIVRLSKCCKANANLRLEAERKARESELRVEELTASIDNLQSRISRKESQVAVTQNKLSELEARSSREARRLNSECTDLKTKLANANHRENHLVMEARKREKQYTHLQQRVHSLLSSSKKIGFNPQITVASEYMRSNTSKYARKPVGRGVPKGEAYIKLLEESDGSRFSEIMGENDEFRNLLRAIQEELDDLILQNPSLFPAFSGDKSNLQETSEVSDGSGSEVEDCENTAPDPLLPAPSLEQMNLPFDLIREEFEASLEQKFQMIRTALSGE